MWTTKGNRFGFIGASVSFIDNNWNYVVQHLSLKLVAWHHKGSLLAEPIVNVLAKHGLQRKIRIHSTLFTKHSNNIADLYYDIYLLCQTTDSGSNNNTMAKTMHQKLSDLEGSELPWDYDTMHIKCFCHKMALVVNAGLNELGLEAPPPPKLKKAFLGAVPYSNNLKPIVEEEEEEDIVDEEGSDNEVDTDDIDEGEEDMAEEDDDDKDGNDSTNCASQQSNKKKTSATNRNESNKLHELTQNVCTFFFFFFFW